MHKSLISYPTDLKFDTILNMSTIQTEIENTEIYLFNIFKVHEFTKSKVHKLNKKISKLHNLFDIISKKN